MKFLVDANVLSEPTRPSPRPAVVVNRLAVATRNVTDFEKAGCEVVNPFEG